jgi:hypothetical protein
MVNKVHFRIGRSTSIVPGIPMATKPVPLDLRVETLGKTAGKIPPGGGNHE